MEITEFIWMHGKFVKWDDADEAFFTGTAAEITPITSLDDKPIKNSFGPITQKLKSVFMDIVKGNNNKYEDWLSYVD